MQTYLRDGTIVLGIIPARFASTRFPGKALALLAGFPLIRHVYAAARACKTISDVWVATDDERIADTVRAFGGNAVMTRPDHSSGTDRIVEALDNMEANDCEFVVNIQGDEPLILPEAIDRCIAAIAATPDADWATLIYPLGRADDIADPSLVKVVRDGKGFALYFSRAPIPFDRDGAGSAPAYGHTGLYVYRTEALRRFAVTSPTPLEQTEKLEQLRALESGMKILCVEAADASPGVDTPADLERVEKLLKEQPELMNCLC